MLIYMRSFWTSYATGLENDTLRQVHIVVMAALRKKKKVHIVTL